MNKYNNSKIYKLVCNNTGLIYYGSTIQPLSQRKSGHKKDYNKYKDNKGTNMTSYKIIEGDNYNIILVENFNCENKEQLRARERYYIENNECINKNIPSRTIKEYKEANKEKINKQSKDYYNINNDKIKNHQKEFYDANKEKISIRRKEQYKLKNLII